MRLKPTSEIDPRPMQMLAADTTTLNQGDGNIVTLIKAPFTPSRQTLLADLTPATYTGGEPKTSGVAPNWAVDPSNGDQLVIIPPPAGGWDFECTAAPVSPETIYGVCVTGTDSGDTWGSGLLPTPVVITNPGDIVRLGTLEIVMRAGALG